MIILKLGQAYEHKIYVVKKYLDYETAEKVGEFFRNVIVEHSLTLKQFQIQIKTVYLGYAC